MEKKADLMSLVEEIKALDLSAKLCGVIHIINDGLADVVTRATKSSFVLVVLLTNKCLT